MPLPIDILQRVASEYNDDDLETVLGLLEEYSGPEAERVMRCVLHLSAGALDRLRENMAKTEQDYRDIIYFAEYDRDDKRVNDFTRPFSPE